MRAEFVHPGDPAWAAFLEAAPHDFYHLPEYVDLCARLEGGEPFAFLAEEGGSGFLAPLVIRPIPGTRWRDACAPYGYPAPLLRGEGGGAALEAFLAAFARLGAEAGLVSAFFRLHPLLPLPREPLARWGALVDHGETVYLDLTLPLEDLERQTRANHRADARRLVREGFQVVMDPWDRLDAFADLYGETMEARGAGEAYRFDRAYFRELKARLDGRLHLCLVEAPDGRTAAGGLFSRVGGLMEFHLAGTSPAFRRAGPAKLMLLHMRDLAKAWGATRLHLGGGVGCREDSLAFFKQGFSRLRAPFSTFRMVLDPPLYAELAGPRADSGAFFPAYRRP